MFAKAAKVIKEILSEPGPNGTLSWGRCAATVALFSGIFWVTKLVLRTHQLPDLSGVSVWASAPYAANKVSTAVQSFSNPPTPATPNPMTSPVVPSSDNPYAIPKGLNTQAGQTS